MNLATIPTFSGAETFHVVVEAPRGSTLKLKYEPRWQAMSISRPLPLGVAFPFDWGFIPSTAAADGDPLDAMVLWDVASYPGVVLECRSIGVLLVEQNRTNHDASIRVRNDRILALPLETRREQAVTGADTLSRRVRDELEQYVFASTALEGKAPRILGWGDAAAALALIRESAAGVMAG
jgi:inorganic pyrophosphatase